MAVSYPAFLSYARRTNLVHAENLHKALGGKRGLGFLDIADVEFGDNIPKNIIESLLSARVVVIFADETYFQRWYCLREFLVAVAPWIHARADQRRKEAEGAAESIVIALPAKGSPPAELDRLPGELKNIAWPRADQTSRLERLVRDRLEATRTSIGERLRDSDALTADLLEEAAIPKPHNLAGLRVFPMDLRQSIFGTFVGRANDLWRIHWWLSTIRGDPTTSASMTVALEGGPGLGKTRIALEYLHRFGPVHFPGGLFWIDAAASEDRLQAQLHGALTWLDPNLPDLTELREAGRDVATELASKLHSLPAKQPVLFIVDNVPDPTEGDEVKPLETWCPARGKVALLVTSRARVSLSTEGMISYPVSPLGPDSALRLLTREVIQRDEIDQEGWREIAAWVGFLPLALTLLNAAMRAGALRPIELLSKAREDVGPAEELDRQTEALRGSLPEGAIPGVSEAVGVSFRRLPPEAKMLACWMAQFAPQPVPEALVDALGGIAQSPGVRSWLISRSFVDQVTSPRIPMFGRMHEVLSDALRRMDPDPDESRQAAGQALAAVMTEEDCRSPVAWPMLDACLPHAEFVLRLLTNSGSEWAIRLQITLWLGVGSILAAQGLTAKAHEARASALRSATSVLGENDQLTLAAMNDVAETLSQLGESHEALRLREQVLEQRRRLLGKTHPDTIRASAKLARAARDLGDLSRAQQIQTKAVKTLRRELGPDHPDTIEAESELAATLGAQGDSAGARALAERVLQARLRLMGEDHPDTLKSRASLADVLASQGDLHRARELQEAVADGCARVFGTRHPRTLDAESALALTLHKEGNYRRSRLLLERVAREQERTLGPEHPTTVQTHEHLAATLRDSHRFRRARQLQETVLRIRRHVLGEEHLRTLQSMIQLAAIFRAQGRIRKARQLEDQATAVRRRVLGDRGSEAELGSAGEAGLQSQLLPRRRAASAAYVLRAGVGMRIARVLVPTLASMLGVWIGTVLLSRTTVVLGPFTAQLSATLGRGVTDVTIPPFGRVTADTHRGPLVITMLLQDVRIKTLSTYVVKGQGEQLWAKIRHDARSASASYALRLLGAGTLGALVLALLVFRTSWRPVIIAGLSALILVAGLEVVAWRTYDAQAFFREARLIDLNSVENLNAFLREIGYERRPVKDSP